MRKFWLLPVFLIAGNVFASDGWVVKTRFYNLFENPSNARVETTFFYKNLMRSDNGDLITIINIEKGEIVYYNTSNKTYWTGTPDSFISEIRADLERMIEVNLQSASDDKRDAMRKMYDEMLSTYFPVTPGPNQAPRNFSLKKVGEGEMIAGFNTQTYRVYEDNQLFETLWVSSELPIGAEFNFRGLNRFLNKLSGSAYDNNFESTELYFNLIDKGYPLKVEITRADGYTYVSDVVKAERIVLPNDHFSVPADFIAGNLIQVGVWNGF